MNSFSRRVFGGNPDSFKLVFEYGRDVPMPQQQGGRTSGDGGGIVAGPVLLPHAESQVRLPVALATLEFEFNSDEPEASVIERFTQRKSSIAFDCMEERVMLKLEPLRAVRGSARLVQARVTVAAIAPALRCIHVARTSSSGSVPEPVLAALLKHCDLSGVWKLRSADGFGHFWCSCCEVSSWRNMRNMNLGHCGLATLPSAIGQLTTLRILRLSHNRLTVLPHDISKLVQLEVLAADHNQLVSIPAELRYCSALKDVNLEGNKLTAPVLDLRALNGLVSLQLYGNPLEYLPELSPATALRSLSLANVRIMADTSYSRWEVEVSALPYMSRTHKLAALFRLTFRRSSAQHPLLAGALGRISEDRSNCELIAKEETALQQLLLMALSEQPVVAMQACKALGALVQLGEGTARRLLVHDVGSLLNSLLRSHRRESQMCGLQLLSNLAAGSDTVSGQLMTADLLTLLQKHLHDADSTVRCAALEALAHAAFFRDNKVKIRSAPGLLQALVKLAGSEGDGQGHGGRGAVAGAAAGGGAPTPLAAGGDAYAAASRVRGQSASSGGGSWPAAAAKGGEGADFAAGVRGNRFASPPPSSRVVTSPVRVLSPRASGAGANTSALRIPTHAEPTAAVAITAAAAPGPVALTALPRALSPARFDQTPMSPSAGQKATGAAAPPGPAQARSLSMTALSGASASVSPMLPPAIALAAPRAVPPVVASRDATRLLAIKILAVLGENDHVSRAVGTPVVEGRGLRVLSMDGGGMRGLVMVQMLRHMQRRAGRPLHELFDLVVGTSTGAILAIGMGLLHYSLEQCEAIYTGLGHKVFNQASKTAGVTPSMEEQALAAQAAQAAGANWRDSLYRVVRGTGAGIRAVVYGAKHDASTFEALLLEMCEMTKLGCKSNQLIDTAALGGPKVAVVSTLASVTPACPFLFTNYELPPDSQQRAAALRACSSSSKHLVWQAVRASSAAPYYLDDYGCGEDRFQDGAAIANNPSVLALQQARLLWPDAPIELLVSLGCGLGPQVRRDVGQYRLLDTASVLIDTATSPDRADEALSVLMPLVPGAKYFRFQPTDERCNMDLDDVDPTHWAAVQAAAEEYCCAHAARFDELAQCLDAGQGAGGEDQAAEGEDGAEAEEGGPGSIKLGARRGVLVLEAPCAVLPGDLGLIDHVAHALGQLPQLLRHCDLSAAAASASASAAATAAHMQAQERQQRQQELAASAAPSLAARGSSAAPTDGLWPLKQGAVLDASAAGGPSRLQVAVPQPLDVSPLSHGSSPALSPLRLAPGRPVPLQPPQQQPSPRELALAASLSSQQPQGSTSVFWGAGAVPRQAGAAAADAPMARPAGGAAAVVSAADAAAEAVAVGATAPPASSLYDYFFGATAPAPTARARAADGRSPSEGAVAAAAAAAVKGEAALVPGGAPPSPMTGAAMAAEAAGLGYADGAAASAMQQGLEPEYSLAMSLSSVSVARMLSAPRPAGLGAPLDAEGSTSDEATDGSAAAAAADDAQQDGGGRGWGPAAGRGPPGGAPGLALLRGLLQDLQDTCGLVHLGLHVAPASAMGPAAAPEPASSGEGLVLSWQRDVTAVVDPGPDAADLVRELGHNPRASTLSALFSTSPQPSLVGPAGNRVLTLLGRQEVRLPGPLANQAVAALLLQVSRPGAMLLPEHLVAAAAPEWAGLILTSAAPLPQPLVAALLSAGAVAVLAPDRPLLPLLATKPLASSRAGGSGNPSAGPSPPPAADGAACGADNDEQEVASFFRVVVEGLVGGQVVSAAIQAAEWRHPRLQGRLVCHHL